MRIICQFRTIAECRDPMSCTRIECGAAPSQEPTPRTAHAAFERVIKLIEDIQEDRFGRPLVAALHLCNDLANENADLHKQLAALPEGMTLEFSTCTLCAAPPGSEGFYTGCMAKDGHGNNWACDGHGNLVRWLAAAKEG